MTISEILDHGEFIPHKEFHYYREKEKKYIFDEGEELVPSKIVEIDGPTWNYKQPRWPAVNSSSNYRLQAHKLYKAALGGKVPFRLSVGETLKAVDCLISQILYDLALYPESRWVSHPFLSYQAKLKLMKDILPKDLYPARLIESFKELRNECEHQYAEPQEEKAAQGLEVMDAFTNLTDDFCGIISDFSMYIYRVHGVDFVVQLQRESSS
ncbi:MAG: hypothetical protein ACI9TH_004599, partial [Kiritimatiellia bacterium]